MGKKSWLGKHVDVTGSMKIKLPQEIIDYYKGKGVPLEFAEKHYGLRKHLDVRPTKKASRSRLLG